MKCKHETTHLIPIRKSVDIYGEELYVMTKEVCEDCKKVLDVRNKKYRLER